MPIIRNTKQTQETLIEFYTKIYSPERFEIRGKYMIKLINTINELFPKTTIWGLTSVTRLVLQTEDNWKSPWFVIITCQGKDDFLIEYLLPEDKQPWKDAYVTGESNYSYEKAIKMMLISMKESEGWKDNQELKKSLSKYH